MDQKINYYKINDKIISSIYDIWERGESYGDSVTPSTWASAYRRMMVELLCRYSSNKDANILSLGCGNATVEGELVSLGYNISGLDLNHEALGYAAQKGIATIEGDFYDFLPEVKFDIVYADGFFGHLWNVDQNARNIYQRISNFMLKPNGTIIVSNDAPRFSEKALQKHPNVPDFYFMSGHYLASEAKSVGLQNIEVNTFFYHRPVSGACPRTIVVSKWT
ncbi:class I SAM-dependent methyltransferase [Pseudovibrio sp. Tun.PSC04-5.I4]|uniref:class I SAM-dependent methyltransferase n=1 Tax=Pseudovibrio sp. Tun.PSC04-5.I4 TaxID=1798213 RepID=UPI0008857EB0|nr:class I SAM-dependent methyltransferase [Pseudovibrio sp. Tun.PSC04-5.I4]SDR49323.1 Methyltransferase domain-containing protein [Pseudovibrio sp. Tun.PSC04-5.I4]